MMEREYKDGLISVITPVYMVEKYDDYFHIKQSKNILVYYRDFS